EERNEKGGEGSVEERRTDRNFDPCERFQSERINGANEHGGTGTDQEKIVEHQRAFTRNRDEQASLFEHGRAQCKEREAAPDEQRQDTKDKDAARRLVGKGVH